MGSSGALLLCIIILVLSIVLLLGRGSLWALVCPWGPRGVRPVPSLTVDFIGLGFGTHFAILRGPVGYTDALLEPGL